MSSPQPRNPRAPVPKPGAVPVPDRSVRSTSRWGRSTLAAAALLGAGCAPAADTVPAGAVDSAGPTASVVSAPTTAPDAGVVRVRGPLGPPSVLLGLDPRTGVEVRANCTTCHTTRPARRETASGDELDTFHQGLVLRHGGTTCLACHDERSYDRLRLADGRALEFVDTMQLCAQCHGPQHRDWQRGSHGGMTGHWDRTRGPRERNHCVVCHDPHAPQLKQVLPAPPPRDRFLSGHGREVHHD